MIEQDIDSHILRVGPTPLYSTGIVSFARYRSGEIAIRVIVDEDSSYVASVSMVPYGAEDPGEFGVWLKGWSENEGVPDALVAAGVVTLSSKIYRNGFVEARHAELTERAREVLARAGV